jgi:hypothetical protein
MRIERLDPPLPPRKYSIYSASFTRAWHGHFFNGRYLIPE